MISSGMQTSNHTNNAMKLIEQNKKLNRQIRMLEKKMSKVIEDGVIKTLQQQEKKSQGESKMQELVVQETYIRKLKEKIKQLRAMNLNDKSLGIIKEENDLVVLKKQYDELVEQKETMKKMYEHKESHLQYNQPLNSFKGETMEELVKIKKRNTEMQGKITELEREVRKYHKSKQLNNSFKHQPIVIENPEFEIKKIEHEKEIYNKKCKLVESKWKPQIQALDKQYFADKTIFERKETVLVQTQKQLKNWQNRSSAVRTEADVLLDRERMSKVIISPLKKQQVIAAKEIPKENILKKSPTKTFPKKKQGFSDLIKEFKETQKSNLGLQEIPEVPDRRKWSKMNESKYGTQSQKLKQTQYQAKYNTTRLSQKNEFILTKNVSDGDPKQEEAINGKKKLSAVVASVGVGTSFYYDDE